MKASYVEHTELSTPLYSSPRNIGSVPTVPPATFREANELYYDGAEGPDKIGHYNVYSWKVFFLILSIFSYFFYNFLNFIILKFF